MDTEKPVIITTEKQEKIYQPFVNEECGDSMWDEVLEEQEKDNSAEDTGN